MSITKTDPIANCVPIKKTKCSDHRKITKPIMERRRRARINNSLDQIKCLILDACDKDPSRYTKLEKADILEMTVGYLQNLRKSQAVKDGSTFLNFQNGFKQCANVVTGFVEKAEGVDSKVKSRLINYISNCTQSLTPVSLAPSSSHVSSTTSSPTSMSSDNIQSMLIGNLLNGIKKSSCTVLPQPVVDANNNTLPNVPITPPTTTRKSCQYPFKFYKSLNNQKVLPPSPSYEVPSSPTSKLLSDAYLLSLYFHPNNGCMWRPW